MASQETITQEEKKARAKAVDAASSETKAAELEAIIGELEGIYERLEKQASDLQATSEPGSEALLNAQSAAKAAAGNLASARAMKNGGGISTEALMALRCTVAITSLVPSAIEVRASKEEHERTEHEEKVADFYEHIQLSHEAMARVEIRSSFIDIHDDANLRRYVGTYVDPSLPAAEREQLVDANVAAFSAPSANPVVETHNQQVKTHPDFVKSVQTRAAKTAQAVDDLLKKYRSGPMHDELMIIKLSGLYELNSVQTAIADLSTGKEMSPQSLHVVVVKSAEESVTIMEKHPDVERTALTAMGYSPTEPMPTHEQKVDAKLHPNEKPTTAIQQKAQGIVKGTHALISQEIQNMAVQNLALMASNAQKFSSKYHSEQLSPEKRREATQNLLITAIIADGIHSADGNSLISTEKREQFLIQQIKKDPFYKDRVLSEEDNVEIKKAAHNLIAKCNDGSGNGFKKLTGYDSPHRELLLSAIEAGFSAMWERGDRKEALAEADQLLDILQSTGMSDENLKTIRFVLRAGALVGSTGGDLKNVAIDGVVKSANVLNAASCEVKQDLAHHDGTAALRHTEKATFKVTKTVGEMRDEALQFAVDEWLGKTDKNGSWVKEHLGGIQKLNLFDADGDGKVEIHEVVDWMNANHIKELKDLNGDGKCDSKDLDILFKQVIDKEIQTALPGLKNLRWAPSANLAANGNLDVKKVESELLAHIDDIGISKAERADIIAGKASAVEMQHAIKALNDYEVKHASSTAAQPATRVAAANTNKGRHA